VPDPVETVDALIRLWRQSPAGAAAYLRQCAGAFSQRAGELESQLDLLLPNADSRWQESAGEEMRWRWNRSGYVLFWILVAVLCFGALAAGYFLALSG